MHEFTETHTKIEQSDESTITHKTRFPVSWSKNTGRIARILLLAATVCVVWLTIENRWGARFSLPTRYDYDAHLVLGMMKLVQQGDIGIFTHIYTNSLGAPFKGQLNDFPQAERALIWLAGKLSILTGLMPASNIMLLLSCIIAAVSFYCALRLWRVSRTPSWLFAITYAFLPHSSRSIQHIGIIFTGLLPLQLYVIWYIATAQKLSWHSRRFKLALIVSLLSGALNIYWVFLFLQLYLGALLIRITKRAQDLTKALIPSTLTFLVAGSFLASFVIYKSHYGNNPMALVRSYGDIEQWALKPIDLLIPTNSSTLPFLGDIISRYHDGGGIKIGENFGSYVGLIAILGFLFLIIKSARQITKKPLPLPLLTALWIIAYSSFGGIHSAFSLVFNFYDIRGTNRYSTAIATIGFMYFVFIIYKLTQKWHPSMKVLALGAVATCGLLEQSRNAYHTPSPPPALYEVDDYVKEDKALTSRLEGELDENSMIYILPATDFPEPFWGRGSYKGSFHHYQAMRPFLYSRKLRYSYGSNKGRQGADWQLDVQELPAGEMAAKLESYGFSGILLNRKGYEDRGIHLLAELENAGWLVEFEQGVDNEWVFIRLNPSSNPIFPTLTPYALSPNT